MDDTFKSNALNALEDFFSTTIQDDKPTHITVQKNFLEHRLPDFHKSLCTLYEQDTSHNVFNSYHHKSLFFSSFTTKKSMIYAKKIANACDYDILFQTAGAFKHITITPNYINPKDFLKTKRKQTNSIISVKHNTRLGKIGD